MKQLRDHHRFIAKSCFLACLFGIVFFSSIAGADAGFSAAGRSSPVGGGGESLQTPKVCANHDCYYALAVDSSQPIAPVLRLALLKEETAIIGTWFVARAAAFDGMGNLNEGYFIPSQGDEDRYWQSIYMLAQAGTGPALAVPQVIRAPSRVVQPQNHDGGAGHILATLQVRNIQVRAKWDVENKGNNFTVSTLAGDSRQGVLRVGDNIILEAGDYVVTVMAIDEFSYLNESYENLTAMAELTIVVESGVLSFAEDSPFVNVTAGIPREGGLYTVRVSVGEDADYEQIGAHSSFTIDVLDGAGGAVVSMISPLLEAMTAILTIEASRDGARATLTLEVRAYDELSASLAAGFVGQTYTGETGILGTVEVSGGSGGYVYSRTPVAGFAGTGGVLEADGQATVGVYTVTVVVSDNELDGWIAATAEVTVSVGAALSLLGIEERRALVQGEEGEELLTVQVSGGKQPYSIIGQDLSSGLTISVLADSSQWVVKRAGDLSVGANVGTVIIDDSYSAPTTPGTPALTAVLTIEGVDNLVIASPQTLTATMGVSGALAELSAKGGTEAKVYKLSPELSGFSLSPAGVLSVSMDVDAGSYTLTVVVSDETARVEQAAMATLLVEVLGRLQLLSVPSLTVTTSEARDVVYSFAAEGGVGEKIYSLENTVTGFGFEIDGGNLRWLGDAEAGLYTLSVLAKDGSPQPQESRVLVTVLVIEDVVLDVVVLIPVWSSFDGAVSTLSASGGNGGELVFGLVGDSQVFTLAAGSSTLSLNAGLRGHQGAATLSATVSVSDGYDSAEEVITVLVSGALQVSLADGLVAPVHAQYEGLVGSVVVLGGYAGEVSLTLSGSDKDKFELSGGSLSLQVDVIEEQILTVTVDASRGDETAAQEVLVSVYAPLVLSVVTVVTVATHKGDVLTIIEGSGGDASNYSYTLTSPPLVGVSINAVNGELLLSLTVAASHTLTVELSDGADSRPVSQGFSVLVIEPLRDIGEVVLAVTLIENVGDADVYTFTVTGGIAPYSYTFVEAQSLSVNAASGVLSYAGGAKPRVYVVTVSADDAAAVSAPITLLLTVEVSAVLSAALSDGAKDGVDSFVSLTAVVPGVELSGVGGIPPYIFTLLANDNFGIDEDGGNFRITAEFNDVVMTSAVWVLEDSDERTPAVTGTVEVEIKDELGFVNNSPVVNVTVGVKSGGVLYTAKAQKDDKATYSQIGRHPSFTVVVSDSSAGALVSMISPLSMTMTVTLTIRVVDDDGAQAILTLEVRAFDELSVALSDGARNGAYSFVNLTGVLSTVELSGIGGIPPYTFTLLANDNFGIDEDGKNFRITAAFASATVVSAVWVLEDSNPETPAVSGTVRVEISVPTLLVELSDGARDGVHSFANLTGVLSAVELSGVGGIPPYTFTLLANDNFGIDEDGKNFRITAAFASATVVSAVWVLEDSNPETPAVSGTVQVKIRDIVRPLAMVRDIVGTISVSGGGADGTYSTGQTLTFDPNIGGVTVDVQADGNSAVVWLENAQIRVSAGYIPHQSDLNPATGEWIFFSAREIAELSSLADPEFKGERIAFYGATVEEAFSTPGMVAIIVGSVDNNYVDIFSQVRYVECRLFKPENQLGTYICQLRQPTLDLSVALSDGVRDGVHSFVNLTGVVHGVELSGVGGIPPYTFTLLANDNFGIDEDGGNFRITAAFASATVVSVVWVLEDSSPWTPAVSGTVRVEISTPSTLSVALSDGARDGAYSFVNFTGVLPAVELSGVGGIPPYTFTLLANDNFGIDADGKNFRITAEFASATVVSVVWVLEDNDLGRTPAVSGTVWVEISVATLSVALSDGARDGVHSYVKRTGAVAGVELSGAGGILPYTFMLLANDNFGIDADGKNFRITAAFASATVVSVVWVLEDSDPGTPAVSGTVQVEIRDDNFEYVVRPPAMVRNIVGEILISGGGADGTYSAGETPAFDTNIGGVTVDVQADGNSAVVLLENAQIRVSAGYIPGTFGSSASGEWIFFSAREIAELVSLSADPEFKGENIYFSDATELKEAFSTPGMVAIMIGSPGNYEDIVSQVRYVGCYFIGFFGSYDCGIVQPTSGFAVLSVELSDGARDGVHSFVNLTGVLSAVELSGVGGTPPYTFTLLDNDNFGIDADGKNFRITAAFASATVVSVVWVLEDSDPVTPAVSGAVQVEISPPPLSVELSDGARDGVDSFVNLTGVLSAVELSGVGGAPPYTFTLLANDNFGIDEDGKNFRITAAFAGATVVSVVWVLEDSYLGTPAVSGTVQVEVSVPLPLSVALSDGARDGVYSFVHLKGVLSAVELSGAGGIPPYTFTLLANDNFGIDEDGKNFRITAAFASATVVSVVWVLEDSDPGTPAVSGTVQVEIRDDGFEYIVRPPAMVRDIVGEILISGGDADGTYSTGETPTFDPNIGGVTVDVQAEGNSAVVWLENAQIRVSAKYVPSGTFNSATTGEWIFFSAREIAGLVSLNANSEFKGRNIRFYDATELKEAFSTPGMVAIIVGSYLDIASQVRYVGCHLVESYRFREYNCRIQQPTLGFSTTLSAALSDGARDGVHSFAKWTGVLSAVELSGVGGIPPYTFTLLANDNFGIDEDGKNFRITAAFASATVVSVVWVLEDSNPGTPAVSGTVEVEVSVPSTLSVAVSDGARDGVHSFVNLTGVLPAVELSGVGGIPPYTFTLLANDNFGIDEDGKNFRITAAFASATVVSVVWVLDDSNPGTPAVSGTVQVEISVPALSVALSDGARDGVHSFVSLTAVVPGVELSGVGGIPPYTFTLLANDNFGIDEDGKNFRITAAFASATVVSVVWVLDDSNPGTPAVSGTVEVEIKDELRFVDNSPVVNVTVGVKSGGVLYTAKAQKYENVAYSQIGYHSSFTVDVSDSSAGALVGMINPLSVAMTVTLTIRVVDDDGTQAILTLEVRAFDELSVALSDGARDGVYSFVHLKRVLSAVELSGIGGIPPYTFTLLANDNFGIDEDGKNFRITAAFASATVASVVWVLEDNNPGTPAVSGTVRVEIIDDGFEYIVRPPAMVRDIVGEILISGGGADGTYSAGQTLTFDPNSGGVTVDVQAEGNSAVVWLENAQIRVSAKYIPRGIFNPATGEWIFFSAREIAELVSLSADPEFRGTDIVFDDDTGVELAEAFSTPGMVAIIVGSYLDIASQVRYVGCHLVESYRFREYNCRIQQPTSGFSATLSAALSDGARDGVHSYVNLTGVLPAVELSGVGGIPPYTFTLLANDNFGIDEDGKNFRITAEFASATVVSVVWVLEDSNPGTPAVSGTVEVEVSVPQTLSVALSDGARDGAYSFVKWTGVLSAVELSGVGGAPPYTFTLLANDNFGIDEDGKNFRITVAFTSATVVSVVWVLEDSDPGTPAVSGTVQVEIYIVRPPAMVRDIVGEILISGGGADGTYSTGQTLTFDPNSGGVTVDVQAVGNSAVVWLENAQIRVSAKYVPQGNLNPATGEWIFFSAREIAELVSINVAPEFKGVPIGFYDATEFKEAFSTPGMVAIIIGSEDNYVDIASQVRYVGCFLFEFFGFREYNCSIQQPTLGFSTTLSVALSEGARDGVHSFVKWTGVVPGVELSGVGGIPPYTFTLLANDNFGIDEDGKNFRITAEFASATVVSVVWVLEDSNPGTPAVSGTVEVEVSVPPTLSVALSDGARDGAYSFVHLKGVLSTVELSGVGGIPPYTFTLLANDNFGIDEDGKNFRIAAEFASATVVSVVWVLEDSDPGTPAVSGTVQVEIRDDGFEYIVRPPAMVRDIVGEILISGGDADGTYSTGQTLTFDPNSGGVTVDVQADGNSAVVWLENTQIRVGAKYRHADGSSPANGEWIFFSAREIAGLVSLNADPEFKGGGIGFLDTSGIELAEAFSTPGMVAIIIGSSGNYVDIASQVRYVGCHLFEFFGFREYNCSIQQPTLGFSTTLSVALSDGARDGVHSFVKWTGVVPGVELSGAGGIPPYTFTLLANDNFGIDEDGKNFRITAEFASATVVSVVWVLNDSDLGLTPAVSGTVRVEISTPLTLSVALSDGARDGVDSFVNFTGVVPELELSGAGGIPPYTFTLLANDNFGIDEDGKNFRITAEFASATVVSVVWVLEDSDPGTPAVSGTVQVEIRDIVRPPAMVRDIVGEILISGGGADGRYSAGETPTFDPNIGGVTVDVQAVGNSAVVWLENAQIRVGARYISADSGEWIFFSAREIAELVSLNVYPRFKDGSIGFLDTSGVELAEAFSTPGMVAIIIGRHDSYVDIVSQVRYVRCFSFEFFGSRSYSCSIRQPTLGFSATLSAALSDGAGDGVHSFVNLTGVLPAVELSGAGGIPPYTFTLLANDNFGIDEDGKNFRITAAFASETVATVVWVLEDSNPGTPAVSGTVQVKISVPPVLSAVLSDGAGYGVHSFVNLTGVLPEVELSGAGGTPPYTFTLLDNDNFGIDEDGKNFRITAAFASATVVSVVWVLEDSNPGTPAVLGTVQVETYVARPPAMVRDIVGEILISGGGADGTYSIGQTLTFDPNIGGVTVDVQADGNSAVVWLENAQIRVNAKYIPEGFLNLASGEWIFWSAREIAELVSLNADPEFKGERIHFADATELKEAFSTPGMVAIINPSVNDGYIVSQVRYVVCNFITVLDFYDCRIEHPKIEHKSPNAKNELRYVVVNDPYSETINIPVVGGVPDSTTGYTFALSPASGYGLTSTTDFIIVLEAANATYTDAGVNYVTVSIHDSQTPPQSGTFVLEVRVVQVLSIVAPASALEISQTESASLLSLVSGGNTDYNEATNERTFQIVGGNDGGHFSIDSNGVLEVGISAPTVLVTLTVEVAETVPSQNATANVEVSVKFKASNVSLDTSVFRPTIDPYVDIPLTITMVAVGGYGVYTYSLENAPSYISVSDNVLVVSSPGSDTEASFNVKVEDNSQPLPEGVSNTDEAAISFTFMKPQAQATANGDVVVSGSESADGSYSSGQTFSFDPKTEQGVTLVLGGASDTAVVTAENGQIRVTLKYFTQTNAGLVAFNPSSGTFVMLDGKKLAQAVKDANDAGEIAISFGGGVDNLNFSFDAQIDEALAIKGGLLAIIAPAGLVYGDGVDIVSGVTYLLCRINGQGAIFCELQEPTSTEVLSAGNALRYAIVSEPYSETIQPSFAAADHYIGDQDRAATHQTVAHSVFADGDNGGQHF